MAEKRCKRCRKIIEEKYTYCYHCYKFEQNLRKFYGQIAALDRLISVA